MFRILILIVCVLFFCSCCYRGIKNELGHARPEVREPGNIDENIFEQIDTMAVYELSYILTNIDVKLDHDPKEHIGRRFLRFYGGGKVSSFTIGYDNETFSYNPDHKLTKEDFDPRKSMMGYYFLDKGKIKIKQFGVEICKSFIIRGEIEIKADTLVIIENNGSLIHSDSEKKVYIKNEIIRKEYLKDWEADW